MSSVKVNKENVLRHRVQDFHRLRTAATQPQGSEHMGTLKKPGAGS